MHYEILDENRIKILPLLKNFKDDFYLAGGTGLALQIGHRDSIDFDFFSDKHIDTEKLFFKLKEVFIGHKIDKIQEEKDTLGLIINDEIKLSFMYYPYGLIEKYTVDDDNLRIASISDIACMKLSAIVSRSVLKDYVDIYYLLKEMSLQNLLKVSKEKMPELDENLILKSLVYFDDVAQEKIMFRNNMNVTFDEVKTEFVRLVKDLNKK